MLADFFSILLQEWTGSAIPLLATADKLGETLDGIAEPGPVTRTPPVAIGRMFCLRRKFLGSIGHIFKTRIHLTDTAIEGCSFCYLPDRFEGPCEKILDIDHLVPRCRLIAQGSAKRLNRGLLIAQSPVAEANLRLGFQQIGWTLPRQFEQINRVSQSTFLPHRYSLCIEGFGAVDRTRGCEFRRWTCRLRLR